MAYLEGGSSAIPQSTGETQEEVPEAGTSLAQSTGDSGSTDGEIVDGANIGGPESVLRGTKHEELLRALEDLQSDSRFALNRKAADEFLRKIERCRLLTIMAKREVIAVSAKTPQPPPDPAIGTSEAPAAPTIDTNGGTTPAQPPVPASTSTTVTTTTTTTTTNAAVTHATAAAETAPETGNANTLTSA